jgi:hypothetical protein
MQTSLLGILVDVSGSMTSAIQSQSGGSQTRLEGFRDSLAQMTQKAARNIEDPSTTNAGRLELFAYGFGFGNPLSALLGDSGAPVRDLLALHGGKDVLTDVTKLAREWSTYQRHIEGLVPHMFGSTPMRSAFETARRRFSAYAPDRYGDRILLIVSDGEPTDASPEEILEVANTLKKDGVLIVSSYVTDTDLTEPRRLYTSPEPGWRGGARLMHDCASPVPPGSPFAQYLKEYGWRFDPAARLFTQVNQSELLAEFMNLVISPLDASASSTQSIESAQTAPAIIERAEEFQAQKDFAKKKQIVQEIELAINSPDAFTLDDPTRLQCAKSTYDLDRIVLYLVEEHDTTAPKYKMRLTRVEHEVQRLRALEFEASLMPLSYSLASFLSMLGDRPHLVEKLHADVRLFREALDDLGKYPHLDSGGQVKRDLNAIIEMVTPKQAVPLAMSPSTVPLATPPPVPGWFSIAGYGTGLLTLLYFMYVSLFSNGNPTFAAIVVLALGTALSSSFLGGQAAAEGRMPLFKNSPLVFSVTSGIAVFVITLALGWYMFLRQPAPVNPDEYSLSIAQPVELNVIVGSLERDKNLTVSYGPNCRGDFDKTIVAAGSHTGKTPKEFLERLQDRLRDVKVKYDVSISGQGRRYEIACK